MHHLFSSFLSSHLLLLLLSCQVLLVFATADSSLVHFHGYKVIRANIVNEEQRVLVEKLGADVWSHDSIAVIGVNDIMVNKRQEEVLLNGGIELSDFIPDVEQRLENERQTLQYLTNQPLASWYDVYHNYSEIIEHYQSLSATFRSIGVAFIPSIGASLEGRAIPAFLFGNPTSWKRIFIQGGQHAREWVSPATVAYITEQLLTLYSTDATVKTLVDNILFVVIPVVNPDGYQFTWTTNRLWRKNRRPNSDGSYGVDLNRNWDNHWGGEGSSPDPISDSYRGTAPFSEPETKAVSQFYISYGPYEGAIDFHSYSQLVLRPYAWSSDLPPNDADAKLVGDGIRDTIGGVHNVSYTSEPFWGMYYASGTAQDWFYSAGKTPLSYTIELRDEGFYGFQLPPDQIIPTGEENYAAFKFFANYILTR